MRTDFLVAALAAAMAGAAPARADVVISTDPTSNMNCSAGVCAPTATDAVLNVTDLENLLASGSISVVTTNGSVQANNIDITAAFSWSNGSTLALDAYQSLTVNSAVSVQGVAGLTILANDGGKHGTFLFGNAGNVTFANLSSSLSINGHSYTLVNSLPGLASAIAGNPSGAYALANSYDASQDGTYSSPPVPTFLTGSVEGLGNTISNLSIVLVHAKHVSTIGGMFSVVQQGALIENLNLGNFNLQANGWDVGGLAGYSDGTLSGDHVQGTLTARGPYIYAGGLVGINDGTIEHSSADGDVVGYGWVGGLVGENTGGNGNGTIRWSRVGGNVTCGGKTRACGAAGGLVGSDYAYPAATSISESFASAEVTAEGTESKHPITKDALAGELVGGDAEAVVIDDSYSTGRVKGQYAGGLLGWGTTSTSDPDVKDSYSTGAVTGANVGGFLCNKDSNGYSKDYWDTTTSKVSSGTCDGDVPGIKGLSSKKLKSGLPQGFDPSIWAQDANINNGFPYLINNPPPK